MDNYEDLLRQMTKEALAFDSVYQSLLVKYETNTFESLVQRRIFESLNSLSKNPLIYKYYGPEYGVKNLIDCSLYFSNPQGFNDIQDCSIDIFKFSESCIDSLVKEELNKYSLYDRNILKKKLNEPKFKSELLRAGMKELGEIFLPQIGISCFTSSKTNDLMWSHYANKHTGICIEYFYLGLISYFTKSEEKATFLKVSYQDNISKIIINDSSRISENIAEWISIKKSAWSYEEELRCIIHPVKSSIIKIPNNIITSVYLGYNISEENKKNVLNYIKMKAKDIRVFQMILGDDLNLKPELILI